MAYLQGHMKRDVEGKGGPNVNLCGALNNKEYRVQVVIIACNMWINREGTERNRHACMHQSACIARTLYSAHARP